MTRRQFELFSWNVRGIGSYEKRRKVFNWIVKHSSQNSIISLQDNRSRGVLIGVRDGLEFKINKEIKDQKGRILILDVDIQEEPYVLINYYANNDQAGQLKTLTELCDLLEKIEFKENIKVICCVMKSV